MFGKKEKEKEKKEKKEKKKRKKTIPTVFLPTELTVRRGIRNEM